MKENCINLVLLDVDGVLTDGSLFIGPDGETCKCFNAKDGVAIALLQSNGIAVGIISGKSSKSLDFRIKQLKFDYAFTGCDNKLEALSEIMKLAGTNPDRVAYIGDDIIDIPVMREVALSIAPSDAHELAIECANYVTLAKGGHGVARESAEFILKRAGMSVNEMYSRLVGHVVQ